MTTLISVATPRFWWRATAKQVRGWVPQDPDAEDGGQRHSDRDDQRWPLIAAVVARVGDALAEGEWTVDPDLEDRGLVEVDGYPGGLTRTEQNIVSAWFRSSEAVRFDPWFEPLTNGRHRIWATMPHFGAALIPILGDALGYANPVDAEVLGEGWPSLYAANVEELDALEWFDTGDPLNASFKSSLVTAASGEFPSPVDPLPPASRLAPPSSRPWWRFWA
ncbi:hypothetical protein [Micropruina sp.]|uniref:hypothetical protein n=1 Tax=Micropruina sp. TaxID=2737536 RepID=UPI0039E2B24B